MHNIEPFYNWRHLYRSEEDQNSPFYEREYSEIYYSNTIYGHYIHPQWDEFGSETLYLKVLQVDYDDGYMVIELIGEWNDCINNDIMFLKRDVIDIFLGYGITKYLIIGENVLNFHAEADDYYEEWFQDVEDGWIAFINFRDHVLEEFTKYRLDYYVNFGGDLNYLNWRNGTGSSLYHLVSNILTKRLGP
jgi:hypothetical protein